METIDPILDEILYLEREYIDKFRGNPAVLHISPVDYDKLVEELGISEVPIFHGMEVVVDEYCHDIRVEAE